MGARIDAEVYVDMPLGDQPLGLVDRDIRLALRVGIDRFDLVLAEDAALLVGQVDGDLRADRRGDRAGGGEGTGEVIEYADADRLLLRRRRQGGQDDNEGEREMAEQPRQGSHVSSLVSCRSCGRFRARLALR